MAKTPVFHRAHYNILAKQFRETLTPLFGNVISKHDPDPAGVVVNLALSMAKRFKVDNPIFDPLKWLDDCSPDTELYPLSELWEDE